MLESEDMKKHKSTDIILYQNPDKSLALEVTVDTETIWLTQAQMAELFATERSVITKHLRNIFNSCEIDEKSNVQKMHTANSDKPVQIYSLDAIISVGYRVNSKQATQFRIWATSVLKEHLLKGYTTNQRRLEVVGLDEFQKAVGLIKKVVETKALKNRETKGLLKVITEYANTWALLQRYDSGGLAIANTKKDTYHFDYDDARGAIIELRANLLKKKEANDLFGNERGDALKGALGSINQSFGGKALYPSIEEKAAHILYFVIKDHPFSDGNKRIGSFLFILYLARNSFLLRSDGERKINDNALVALALLIAESNAKEKDTMIRLVVNLLQ